MHTPVYRPQRENHITSSPLQARLAGDNLTCLAKARFENQLIGANRALIYYAAQLAKNDLLSTLLPEKIQKAKWLKPKMTYDKATRRSMTGAEVAEQAANKAE